MYILCLTFFLIVFAVEARAVEDPLSVANNRFGVHILFASELDDAARLVNSNGGEWGYVTIPIQAGDRDLEKWQKFMDKAKELHVIPIIRLATEGDYFNTKIWRKPKDADIVDFANFLNSLLWPTKNRYIIVFNEPNRADEWGTDVSPSEYANILSYAVSVFKSKSQDFFILSAGFDNAASTNPGVATDEYEYMWQMNAAIPGIYLQIDGLSSHSYPNPSFSKPPSLQDKMSIATFRHEKKLVKELGGKDLPVFITETGWSEQFVSSKISSDYFKEAFDSVWSEQDVVAVTPFLLRAGMGPFAPFSLIDSNGEPKPQYRIIESLAKIKGKPVLPQAVLGERTSKKLNLPVKDFSNIFNQDSSISLPFSTKKILKWLLKI